MRWLYGFLIAILTILPVGCGSSTGSGGSGFVDWVRNFGGSGDDRTRVVAETSDGFIIAGSSDSFGNGDKDAWLVKTDTSGNPLWSKVYGTRDTVSDKAFAIQQTKDHGFIVAGESSGRLMVMKIDDQGRKIWAHIYSKYRPGKSIQHNDPFDLLTITSIQQTDDDADGDKDDGFVITCGDAVVKLTLDGDVSWDIDYSAMGVSGVALNSVRQTPDGGFIAAGSRPRTQPASLLSPADYFLVRIRPTGSLDWDRTFTSGDTAQANDVIPTSDGGFAMVGQYLFNIPNYTLIEVFKLDASGNLCPSGCWRKYSKDFTSYWDFIRNIDTGHAAREEEGSSIQETPDGFIVAGSVRNFQTGSGSEGITLKILPDGNLSWWHWYGDGAGTKNDTLYFIEPIDTNGDGVSDDGFVAAGRSQGFSGAGGYDMWTMTLDSSGNASTGNLRLEMEGGTADDAAYAIRQTDDDADGNRDDGFVVAGYIHDTRGNSGDNIVVMKLDSNLNTVWKRNYGDTADQEVRALQVVSDGIVVAVSAQPFFDPISSLSESGGGRAVDLLKLDPDGEMWVQSGTGLVPCSGCWAKKYDAPGDEEPSAVIQTADGGYVVAGTTNSFGSGGRDAWVMKLDANGDLCASGCWQKTYGTTGDEEARSIQQTDDDGDGQKDDGFIVGGRSRTNGWSLKLDGNGTILWEHTYTRGSLIQDIRQTSDLKYIAAGDGPLYGGLYGGPSASAWVLKLDENGDLCPTSNGCWGELLGDGTAEEDLFTTVAETSDNGYVVAGYTRSFGGGQMCGSSPCANIWLFKLDKNGTILWQKSYGTGQEDRAYAVRQTSDGGYIVAGQTDGVTGDNDGWVLKLDRDGEVSASCPSGIAEDLGVSVVTYSDPASVSGASGNVTSVGNSLFSYGYPVFDAAVETGRSCLLNTALRYLLTVETTMGGNVASTPLGVACPANCSESYLPGTPVSLNAVPNNGWTFSGWRGDCSGTGNPYNLVMNENRSCHADFVPTGPFTLNVQMTGSGSGTVTGNGISCGSDCTEILLPGTQVTLTAAVSGSDNFLGWIGCDYITVSDECVIAMNGPRTVTATFSATPGVTLTVSLSGTGTLRSADGGIDCPNDCSQDYSPGTAVQLTAVGDSGFSFDYWSACPSLFANGSHCDFTINADTTVSATFVLTPSPLLSVTKTGTGTGTVLGTNIACAADCDEPFASGTQVTLTAVANAASHFTQWGGDCSGLAPQTDLVITANKACAAQFDSGPGPAQQLIVGGNGHTCMIRPNGTVKCWGLGAYLGDGSAGGSRTPVTVSGIPGRAGGLSAVALAAGGSHTCALLSDKTVVCWGANGWGQLGNGTNTNQLTPVPVTGITNATAIATGSTHTCAVLSDTTVRCWGNNTYGTLGNGGTNPSGEWTPVTVMVDGITPLNNVISVAAAQFHTCALKVGGTVHCWGTDYRGAVGIGVPWTGLHPFADSTAVGVANAQALGAGGVLDDTNCTLYASGSIQCWGFGDYGQLGNGTYVSSAMPENVTGIVGAIGGSVGRAMACALMNDGTIRCWGSGTLGELGNGADLSSTVPVDVTGISGAVFVGSGPAALHTCAVFADASVKCWGYNNDVQLGAIDPNNPATIHQSNIPLDVPGL